MTAPQTWSVYSVEAMTPDASNPGFNVVKTRWTAEGPDAETTRVVASLEGVEQEEAEERARALQAGYDRVRGQLPVPAAGEKL